MKDEDRRILNSVYRNGFEKMYNRGIVRAYGGYLIIRGITLDDTADGSDPNAILLGGANDDVRNGVAFEVVSVGPDVPKGKIKVGDHVRFMSASAMPTQVSNGRAKGRYLRVHHDHITEIWDPDDVVRSFRGSMYDPDYVKKVSQGLATGAA